VDRSRAAGNWFERACGVWTLAAVTLVGSGCAVTTADGRRLGAASEPFRAYVESVFRAQNEVLTELAFALEEPGAVAELTAAEDLLLAACAPLNELAAAARDRQRRGARERLRAARSAPDCERATLAAAAALERARAPAP
jgi:hypothetical protein